MVGSFDRPRVRPAPSTFRARRLDGDEVDVVLRATTLIIAVKPDCAGCDSMLAADRRDFAPYEVLFVAANADETGRWRADGHDVLVAPDVLNALDVRWPPFYVLVDPARGEVVTEGVVFGPAQVRRELSALH